MELLDKRDVDVDTGLELMQAFISDPFIEENDPDLAKALSTVYNNLIANKTGLGEGVVQPTPHRHRHRKHHE